MAIASAIFVIHWALQDGFTQIAMGLGAVPSMATLVISSSRFLNVRSSARSAETLVDAGRTFVMWQQLIWAWLLVFFLVAIG